MFRLCSINLVFTYLFASCLFVTSVTSYGDQARSDAMSVKLRPARSTARTATSSAKSAAISKADTKANAKAKPAPRVKQFVKSVEIGNWMRIAGSSAQYLQVADSPTGFVYAKTLGFTMDRQFVIVPWTFIAQISLARSGARFFLEEPSGRNLNRVEARVVDFDLGADAAVLRLDRPVAQSYSKSDLRLDPPDRDESLMVLSGPNWLRADGKFLGLKSDGHVTQYRFSVGSGTAGPEMNHVIFDRLGRLVALASSEGIADRFSDHAVWAAPARSISEMLLRQEGPRPAAVNANQLHNQLQAWQDHWTQSLLGNMSTFSLQSLDCQPRMTSVADMGTAAVVRSDRALSCLSRFSLPMGSGYKSGLSLVTGEAILQARFDGSDSAVLPIERAVSASAFSDLENDAKVINLLTVPICETSTVTNRHGEPIHVRFCTSALKREPGYNDSILSVTSMQAGNKTKYAVARLRGFNQDNSRKILVALVENLRSLP